MFRRTYDVAVTGERELTHENPLSSDSSKAPGMSAEAALQ